MKAEELMEKTQVPRKACEFVCKIRGVSMANGHLMLRMMFKQWI
jgi:hypothetical protein